MLQIDENQLQVYSCTFDLFLGNASLPLKFKDARYYVEWKVKNKQTGIKSSQKVINGLGYVQFQQKLKIHTQILRNIRTKKFLKKYGQITLFLISSKAPERPKIVGSMLIQLHEVLNSNKHEQMKWARLSLSPFDVDLQLKCSAIECRASSILEANLDAALTVKESFITRSGIVTGLSNQRDAPVFLKTKITTEFYQQDDRLSKGDCSILRPELEEVVQIHQSPIQSPSSLLINSTSIIQEIEGEAVNIVDQVHEAKIITTQLRDVQQLIKENSHLKRLLIVSKTERRMEVERYELELREIARELSLKEAELLKLTETQQSGSVKVGELLDSATYTIDNFKALKDQNEALTQQLSIQRQYNTQLDQNFKRLETRLQMVKDWQHQRAFLMERISQVEEENEHYQLKYFDLQNKRSIHQQELVKSVKQMTVKIKQVQDEVRQRDKIIQLYEDKLKHFQEEITFMQQEVVSRAQYSARSETTSMYQESCETKQKDKGKINMLLENNHIRIQGDDLKGIEQQELEESYISLTGQKQIATAAELPPDHFCESDFYRKMASNVQSQLDQLHLLYRQKDRVLLKERATSKSLYEELQRLRFEFVYQLSKVTSQLNNKVLEIRQLKEQNTFLRQKDMQQYAQKLRQLEEDLNALQQQRLEYFDRCYRLSEENLNILNLNKEKEEIYLSIIKNQHLIKNQDEDFISTHFHTLFKFMLKNQSKYRSFLRKCGFPLQQVDENCPIQGTDSSPPLFQNSIHSVVNQSNIFQKVSPQNNLSDSGKNSSIPYQQELLIQSTARHPDQQSATQSGTKDPSSLIQQMLSDLSVLKGEREKSVSLLRQLSTKSELSFKKPEKISPFFQLLKKNILALCEQSARAELIKIVKILQLKLSSSLQFE